MPRRITSTALGPTRSVDHGDRRADGEATIGPVLREALETETREASTLRIGLLDSAVRDQLAKAADHWLSNSHWGSWGESISVTKPGDRARAVEYIMETIEAVCKTAVDLSQTKETK